MEAEKGGTGCAGRAADRKGRHMRHLNPTHEISLVEPADVAPVLRECVARRTLALVLDLETEWLSRAEFAAFSDRSVMLDVFHATADCYPSASLALVAFVWGEQTRAFLAPVVRMDARPAPDPSRLEIDMPLEIASAMGQIRYRVPVFHDSGLDVKVIPDDRPRLVRAQAVNLSLTGILIEFAEGADPHLAVGAGLTIALSLGKQGVSLAGEVVRTRERQYGIRFRDVWGIPLFDAPEALRMIVRVLERQWLRERVRTGDIDANGEMAEQRCDFRQST